MDNKELIKERLNVLTLGLRDFVLNENWRRDTERLGKQFNFNEEKYALFENEVFLVLLCFEPKADFAENLKRELEVDDNIAGMIAGDINKDIFSQVGDDIDMVWHEVEQAEKVTESPVQQNSVGESFEQIILNQAKAMHPAVEASEEPKVIRPVERPLREAPKNLPAEQEKPRAGVPDYTNGDPYREPIG